MVLPPGGFKPPASASSATRAQRQATSRPRTPPVALDGRDCRGHHHFPCGRRARRGGAPADVRHHQPPRRRQDHADREVPALRRCGAAGRRGQGARGAPLGDVGLDGAREAARHLDQLDGAAVPLPRPRREPARHAGPQGLLRGHVPRARRRRRRGHGARHGQGHRVPDPQAVRGVPQPAAAGAHVPQQVRPTRPRAAGAARRDRGPDRPAPDAGDVAGRHRRRPARRDRPPADRAGRCQNPYIRYARTDRGASLAPEEIVPAEQAAADEGAAWQTALDEIALLDAVGADVDVDVVPRRRLDTGLRRLGAHQLRRAHDPRRRRRPRPARRRRGPTPRATSERSTPGSRRSSSRCRRTWTRRTATVWPSPASARAASTAG